MARVTVEDCIVKIPNRFDLVMMAGQRAREISAGSQLTLDRDNDKNPVVALREVAAESVELDGLREGLVRGLQRHSSLEDEEAEDVIELMAGEQELANVDAAAADGGPDDAEAAGDVDVARYADADEVSEDDPADLGAADLGDDDATDGADDAAPGDGLDAAGEIGDEEGPV